MLQDGVGQHSVKLPVLERDCPSVVGVQFQARMTAGLPRELADSTVVGRQPGPCRVGVEHRGANSFALRPVAAIQLVEAVAKEHIPNIETTDALRAL